jgi:hypothetical protein
MDRYSGVYTACFMELCEASRRVLWRGCRGVYEDKLIQEYIGVYIASLEEGY